MRVLVDTNILISALLYPAGNPAKALLHAAKNHSLVLTEYNCNELRRVAQEKFDVNSVDIESFLSELPFELIPVPAEQLGFINDPKDSPILSAAIHNDVDVIITGDKHFLRLDISRPKPLTASQYLADEADSSLSV